MDILACPIDKYYPLELHVFEEGEEIIEGVIICPKCLRWYPIRDEIPEMLPTNCEKKKMSYLSCASGRIKFLGRSFQTADHSVSRKQLKRRRTNCNSDRV